MRKEWNKYYNDLTSIVAEQSTCLRRKVGAVAVKDKQILATGFNGAPAGLEHCSSRGCFRQQNNIPSGKMPHLCVATHAEQNVITQAAKHGISLKGATLYVNTHPCVVCTKLILNAGFAELRIGANDYPDELSKTLLAEAEEKGIIKVVRCGEDETETLLN